MAINGHKWPFDLWRCYIFGQFDGAYRRPMDAIFCGAGTAFGVHASDEIACRPCLLFFMEVIAYTRLGHELSKEGGNVVEVVDDKEDGEADGETEDDGESNEELSKMI